MKILIAEDDLTSRTVLAGILKKRGHEVVATVDGAEAWETLCQPDTPPLAILDWMMPKMDGLEVVRRVRAMQTDRPPYIIMLTTKDDKADIVTALESGANDYLPKPFDVGELLARIEVGQRMVEMHAKVLASEKLAVMGRLIANVSHEINNPLTIISGNVQRLAKMVREQVPATPDSEEKARMLESIRNATERCRNIVASLLVSTRPTILELHFTDINRVVEKTLESMDDQFKRQNVSVTKTFTVRRPILEADEHRLGQVFVSMFTNSCDAMPEGGKLIITTRLHAPRVGASGEVAGEKSSAVEIEISDTGKGIEAGDLFKIFDPFTTTKKDGKGVGLGLSISSGIVREHGGTISVTSEKGKGATFIIRLPVTE